MTLQEIFNTVYVHFIVNKNPPSMNANDECLYRGRDGAKCAIGLFIPDKNYDDAFELDTLEALPTDVFPFELTDERKALLYSLQLAHDSAAVDTAGCPVETFHALLEHKLYQIARSIRLVIPQTRPVN